MTRAYAERYIREENDITRSLDDQVALSDGMWDQNILPQHDGLRLDEMEDELGLDLNHRVRTVVDNLVEIDVLEGSTPPGPEYYAISERLDEIILGRVDDVATEEIEAIIDHIHDDDPTEGDESTAIADGAGATLRGLLADEFGVVPDAIEEYLRRGDQVQKLNHAVDAIEDAETLDTRDTYEGIIFRRGGYRYTLTQEQVARYERTGEV